LVWNAVHSLDLAGQVVVRQRVADVVAVEHAAVVQGAHRRGQHAVTDRVVIVLAAAPGSDHIVQVQRQRRRRGLAGAHLAGQVEIAPGSIGDHLVQEQVELRLADPLARHVRRLQGHFQIAQLGIQRGHLRQQQIAQRARGRGDRQHVAHGEALPRWRR
jgi:hypothetical protein